MERTVTLLKNTRENTLLLGLVPAALKPGVFFKHCFLSTMNEMLMSPWSCPPSTPTTPLIVYSIGLVVSLLAIFAFICMCKRKTTRPQSLNHLPVTTQHQQAPPQYPPGMQIDRVIDKWRTQGMEPTLVPLQSTGRDTLAQEPKIRRNVYDLPNGKLYSGNKKIDGQFGKPDTA